MSTETETKKPQVFSISYRPLGEEQPIELTTDRVKRFLVKPTKSGALPTHEDIVQFMMLCQAQGLNPWVRDAFLVGYDGKDGPQFSLITAHQAFLKRAEASHEYDGMESGVVVLGADGAPSYREGDLVLDGEELVGGWARAYRKDRKQPSFDALKLATYNTGRSRWAADPAGMIVKCAEASALRKAFPSNLAGLLIREEMDRVIDGEFTKANGAAPRAITRSNLNDQIEAPKPSEATSAVPPAEAFPSPSAEPVGDSPARPSASAAPQEDSSPEPTLREKFLMDVAGASSAKDLRKIADSDAYLMLDRKFVTEEIDRRTKAIK